MRTPLGPMEASALRALERAQAPLSAYDVMAALRAERPTAAAPTAYRALAKLIARGLVHRLESLNAYVACCADHGGTAPLFSICDDCGAVGEMADASVVLRLAAAAGREGFVAKTSVIELHGRCAGCSGGS